MHHAQHPLHQVELKAMHIGTTGQLAPDHRLFGRTIHLRDAQAAAHVAIGNRSGVDRLRGRLRLSAGMSATSPVLVFVLLPAIVGVTMDVLVMTSVIVRLHWRGARCLGRAFMVALARVTSGFC